MSDEIIYEIANGSVRQKRTVVMGTTPLSDFLEKLQENAPKPIKTPVLPDNCLRYCKVPYQNGFREIITVFSPACLVTVAWKERGQDGITHHEISFPSLVFKFCFNEGGVILEPRIAVAKKRPTRNQDQLYTASMPNVWDDSRICMTPQSTPGDYATSCVDTVQSFYTGQAFNDDLQRWPPGAPNISEWESRTKNDPRWIENAQWRRFKSFGDWSTEPEGH